MLKISSPFKIRDKLQRNKMNSELFRDLRIKFCRFLHGIAENREPSPSSWNICIMYLEWNCSVRNLEKISLGMNKLRNASRGGLLGLSPPESVKSIVSRVFLDSNEWWGSPCKKKLRLSLGKITINVHQCQRKHYVWVVKTFIILKVSDFQLFLLSSVHCKLENF